MYDRIIAGILRENSVAYIAVASDLAIGQPNRAIDWSQVKRI